MALAEKRICTLKRYSSSHVKLKPYLPDTAQWNTFFASSSSFGYVASSFDSINLLGKIRNNLIEPLISDKRSEIFAMRGHIWVLMEEEMHEASVSFDMFSKSLFIVSTFASLQ